MIKQIGEGGVQICVGDAMWKGVSEGSSIK